MRALQNVFIDRWLVSFYSYLTISVCLVDLCIQDDIQDDTQDEMQNVRFPFQVWSRPKTINQSPKWLGSHGLVPVV